MKPNKICATAVLVVLGLGYPIGTMFLIRKAGGWNDTHALALSAGAVMVLAAQVSASEWQREEIE